LATTTQTLCQRCVLPEAKPQIFFDADGVCNLCRDFEKTKDTLAQAPKLLESDLLKIIAKHKGKQKYDCLAMCSGGKDSTSALYYMKTRYGLNPLAFMFDNGFEQEDAIENVENAANKLGVDFLFFRSNHMKRMFAELLAKDSKAVICHFCSIWYMDLAYETAARYEIPMIVAGWTKGQSTRHDVMNKCGCNSDQPEFQEMAEATKAFMNQYVKHDPQYKSFPYSMEEVLTKWSKRKILVISPHWFLPFDQETYVATIQRELGWKFPKLSYPGRSTNCALNFVSVHQSLKHFGYTHYHVEMSKMIRQGLMNRDDALRDLQVQISEHELKDIAEKLGQKIG
jgi:hypothetical protein